METQYTVAAAVLAHVQQDLQTAGRPVGATIVAAGGIVIDDCCIGQLTVAIERVFRYVPGTFPVEATSDEQCVGHHIGLDVLVRIDRCVPVIDAKGSTIVVPTLAEQEEAHRGIYTDAAVIWNSVSSPVLVRTDRYGDAAWDRANVAQLFTPAEGQCAGSETRLSLGVPSTNWCTEP